MTVNYELGDDVERAWEIMYTHGVVYTSIELSCFGILRSTSRRRGTGLPWNGSGRSAPKKGWAMFAQRRNRDGSGNCTSMLSCVASVKWAANSGKWVDYLREIIVIQVKDRRGAQLSISAIKQRLPSYTLLQCHVHAGTICDYNITATRLGYFLRSFKLPLSNLLASRTNAS